MRDVGGVPKITGMKAHQARVKRIAGPEMVDKIGQALLVAGSVVQTEAQILITTGSVSGKGHVPSKPGEAPHNDTATLANNIEAVRIEPLKVEVSSNAPYAAALEYGTSKMAARPYMAPAVARTRHEVGALVVGAVKRVVGGARGAAEAGSVNDARRNSGGVKGRT